MVKEYITKDSGKHKQFETGFRRDVNEGKPRFDLMYPKLLPYKEQLWTRVAELLTRGAYKYSERNWELASTEQEYERFKEGFARHANQVICEEKDEDHYAACVFNLMGMVYIRWRIDNDPNKNSKI